MRVKNYKEFILENNGDKSQGEILQHQLMEFNTKKSNLKNLIMGNIDNDKDITKNYKDIVSDNPFLSAYGNMIKTDASIISKENKLKELGKDISDLNNDINLLGRLSDDEGKEEQQNKIKDQIKSKNDQINDIKNDIKEIKNKVKLMEEGIKELIKEKTQILNDIKKSRFNF